MNQYIPVASPISNAKHTMSQIKWILLAEDKSYLSSHLDLTDIHKHDKMEYIASVILFECVNYINIYIYMFNPDHNL